MSPDPQPSPHRPRELRTPLLLFSSAQRAFLVLCLASALACRLPAQSTGQAGTYRNPILFADYSDPDVIRDGNNYYLISSSFAFVPGIPILQSTDLVHWTIIAHVIQRIEINPAYDMAGGNRYGRGVWAPAIRKHNGLFYVYFPSPDEGIFVSTASKITGPWSKPVPAHSGTTTVTPTSSTPKKAQARSSSIAWPLTASRSSTTAKK
jgi:hypothetical protein